MVAKTTSSSCFDFGFVFYALELVENESNLKKYIGALVEIFGVKVEKFENYFKKLREFPTCNFLYVVVFVGT